VIDHLRAAFVAFHLVAITLMALPAPGGGMNRGAWKDPTVQDEFAAWAGRLGAIGVRLDSAQLQDHAWTFATGFMGARERVLAPFQLYYRYCGTSQSWRMFIAPHRYPSRLWISVERGGVWAPVYVERDPTHTWKGGTLDQDRFRSIIFRVGWPQYGKTHDQFADWLAAAARVDFPDATRLKVAFWKQRSPTPAEARAGIEPDGQWDRVEVRSLVAKTVAPK
jgi:hypothetical protein